MKIGYKIINNRTYASFGECYVNHKDVWTKSITKWIMRKMQLPQSAYNWIKYLVLESLLDKINYYGIAKCHPEDDFNICTGQELARQRLFANFNKTRDKILNKFIKIINNIPHVHRVQHLANYRATIIHNIYERTKTEEMLNYLVKDNKDIDQYRRKNELKSKIQATTI